MSGEKDLAVQWLELQAHLALHEGVDVSERVVQIVGEIDEDMFASVDAKLSLLENQGRKAITLRLSSTGGSLYDALAIVGRMKRSPCNILTEGYGCVMSAATMILAAGSKRRMSSLAWFMTHEGSYGVDGKHADIKNLVQQYDREESMWNDTMANLTGVGKEVWTSFHKKDTYLTAEECLKLNIVDELF